jgi:hypothetical protein
VDETYALSQQQRELTDEGLGNRVISSAELETSAVATRHEGCGLGQKRWMTFTASIDTRSKAT